MILSAFTLFHVLLSLAGIISGFVVAFGLLTARRLEGWTAVFLWTTVATSATGFLFPFHRFLPSHAVGIVSLIVLAVALYARYKRQLAGAWQRTYVVTAMIAFYLNVFVLVAQLFMKVPALKVLAPTQSEPPFKVTQLVVLAIFIVLGVFATLRFRNEQLRTT
jgi:hypothetical protein